MNAKILAGIALVLALLVGVFAYVSSQSSGMVVAKASSTPAAVSATPTKVATPIPTIAVPTATPEPTKTSSPFALELAGFVIDKSGTPVSGATVRAYRASAGCAQFGVGQAAQFGAQSTSAADGSFALKVPNQTADAQGKYFLYVQVGNRLAFFDQRSSCDGATIISSSTPNLSALRFVLP